MLSYNSHLFIHPTEVYQNQDRTIHIYNTSMVSYSIDKIFDIIMSLKSTASKNLILP
jgi:hypothetical protein